MSLKALWACWLIILIFFFLTNRRNPLEAASNPRTNALRFIAYKLLPRILGLAIIVTGFVLHGWLGLAFLIATPIAFAALSRITFNIRAAKILELARQNKSVDILDDQDAS